MKSLNLLTNRCRILESSRKLSFYCGFIRKFFYYINNVRNIVDIFKFTLMTIYVYCHQKNSLNIQKILYMTMLTLKLTKQIMLNFLQKMYMLSGTISRSETPKLCSVQTFLTECITKSHIMSTEMKYISTHIRSG